MKTPAEILRDIEPGNDQRSRQKRRNDLNHFKIHVEKWIEELDALGKSGPYRHQMQAAVDDLIVRLKNIRPDG